VLKGIARVGFTEPTPVQARCFEALLDGRDLMAQAQTGTGKTATFLLTILDRMCNTPRNEDGTPRALVLSPTRELTMQIAKEGRGYGKGIDARIAAIYGGEKYHKQEVALAQGVDIVVSTPGRLLDFSRQGKLSLEELLILVIDEADRMFDMGFWPDIERILRLAPPVERRQTMLFSATLGQRARGLAYLHMRDPVVVEIEPEKLTAEGITEKLYHVATHEKFPLLLGILGRGSYSRVLIFTNTKNAAALVSEKLSMHGYTARSITGDVRQSKRIRALEDFRSGKLPILVASDVASRGLHVEDIELIVNYDLPQDPEAYVHRIGRTARLDNTGIAISLADERFVYSLEAIEGFIGRRIPAEIPEADQFSEDKYPHMRRSSQRRGRSSGGRDAQRGSGRSRSSQGRSSRGRGSRRR